MKEHYFYSASRRGFYPGSMKEAYEKSVNGWPDDAVEITAEKYNILLRGQENGREITPDANGKPVLTDPMIDWKAKAESQRQSLLTSANATIADWRTELQLDVISDEDKASLIKWMAYIRVLKVLDLTNVKDEAGYKAIAWPEQP